MTCSTVKLPDGTAAIVCGPRQRRRKCSVFGCTADATKLCDHPASTKSGTCDRAICGRHATPVGKDLDHCPRHRQESLAL